MSEPALSPRPLAGAIGGAAGSAARHDTCCGNVSSSCAHTAFGGPNLLFFPCFKKPKNNELTFPQQVSEDANHSW
jgi:hypothetical protein